jgi:[citrate (pro-3S)-lyase] ligase
MYGIIIEPIDLKSEDRQSVDEFLGGFDLSLDDDVEYTVAARLGEKIVGTCSFAGKVLKCFGVSEEMQGEGISASLITHLTDKLFEKGIYETFIFTKPKNKGIFEGLGYGEVHSTKDVILLEGGMANVKRYVQTMFKKSGLGDGKKAALVMNCNPFTLGHRYLIETAAQENDEVVVFIVEEERSLFPFNVRLNLVRRGTEDLKNVHVIPGGNYIISSSTFPSYFLRQDDERMRAYTRLDAGIFGKFIAPAFNIVKRYVGTEPYCQMTGSYNEALKSILPVYGVDVNLIERLEVRDKAVSASEVRNLIRTDNWEEIGKIVPDSTYEFLKSEAADTIIKKIKGSDSLH